eukprot:TRINITY_DN31305_c0_g1_i1.p1 TRINITY_DN31305_c0_g1~~TRINITY_DN31305_c0_g1_i1.p1  ORF type:complete len:627 (+),score=169.72 TRINITY_DN31305_c0_g1_i1:113-1993(+)
MKSMRALGWRQCLVAAAAALALLDVAAAAAAAPVAATAAAAAPRLTLLRRGGASGEARVAANATFPVTDTTDKLQGVLDAVIAKVQEIANTVSSANTVCSQQQSSFASRLVAQSDSISALEASRLRGVQEEAKLQAELTHLASTQAAARTSYDAATRQRAEGRQRFVNSQAAGEKQAQVLGEILTKLNSQRAVIEAPSANATGYRGEASGGSQLKYVTGVFGSMRDSVVSDMADEVKEQGKQDVDLKALVASYKDALDRADGQHLDKGARLSEAKAAVSAAAAELSIRRGFATDETKASDALAAICVGASSRLPALQDKATRLQSDFRQRVELALASIAKLPADGAANFIARQRSKRESALALNKPDTRQRKLDQVPAASPVAAFVRALHTPARRIAGLSVRRLTQGNATQLSDYGQECLSQKQTLTASIVAAREATHAARAKLAETEAEIAALAARRALLQAQAQADSTCWNALGPPTDALQGFASGADLTGVLGDASAEVGSIRSDVAAYASTDGAAPAAAGAVVAIDEVVKALTALQTELPPALSTAAGALGDVRTRLASQTNSLTTAAASLDQSSATLNGNLAGERTEVEQKQQAEQALVSQLEAAEAACEAQFFGQAAASG